MSLWRAAFPNLWRSVGNPRVAKTWAENSKAIRDARGEMYGAAGRLLFLRLATVGQRLGQAKTEIGQALNGLQNIGNVSAATAGGCVVLGLEMYLLFHVGEAIGRFNLIGYPVGPEYPDKHH